MYDCVIIGSGPAAYTAGIYSIRAGLNVLIIEGINRGGQLITTTEVENFPGFPNGINGFKLMDNMRQQCINLGSKNLTLVEDDVVSVSFGLGVSVGFGTEHEVFTAINKYLTKTVIIATGATAKKLDITNGEVFWNHGISACAVCDGPLPMFRNKPLVVVGGGDTACEEALFLSRFGSTIYVLVRGNKMRASFHMRNQVENNPKIKILYRTQVVDAYGITINPLLQGVTVKDDDKIYDIQANGLFYAIGHIPNTSFLNGSLKLNDTGYIITNNTKTSIPGVFACGDVQDYIYRQAITAAGSGCMAALEAERYISEL